MAGIPVDELLHECRGCRVDLRSSRELLAEIDNRDARLRCAIIAATWLVRQQWPLIGSVSVN